MDIEARKAKIEERARRNQAVTDAARDIQAILERARAAYGGEAWDDDDAEASVFELLADD